MSKHYLDMSDDEQYAVIEASTQRSLDNPMPPELRQMVSDAIEPHTINAGIKHGEVMHCVAVVYPIIRDHLESR